MTITKNKNINEKLNKLTLPFFMYDISIKSIFVDEVNILAKMVSDITGIDYKLLEDNVVLETNELPVNRMNEKAKKCDFILKIYPIYLEFIVVLLKEENTIMKIY